MNRTRIVIADDHAVLRDGLKTLFNSQPDLRVVGEAGTVAETLEVLRTSEPRVLCLDLSMPGGGGAVIEDAVRLGVRVIVYSMHDDPAYARSALASGALGYVLKSSPPATLITCLRSVAAGHAALDPQLPAEFPAVVTSQTLSRREQEVIELLVRGHTNQAIADQLFVSIKSIETYRARIREKTGLKTRADFIQYGISKGLLEP